MLAVRRNKLVAFTRRITTTRSSREFISTQLIQTRIASSDHHPNAARAYSAAINNPQTTKKAQHGQDLLVRPPIVVGSIKQQQQQQQQQHEAIPLFQFRFFSSSIPMLQQQQGNQLQPQQESSVTTTTTTRQEISPSRTNLADNEWERVKQFHTPAWGLLDRLLGLVAIGAILMGIYNIYEGHRCHTHYVSTNTGRVISARRYLWGSTLMLRLKYEYEVNGQRYVNTRVRAGSVYRWFEPWHRVEGEYNQFAKGNPITVYYDPDHPSASCCFLPKYMYWQNIPLILAGALMALVFLNRNRVAIRTLPKM